MKAFIYGQVLKKSDIPFVKELIGCAISMDIELIIYKPYLKQLNDHNILSINHFIDCAGYVQLQSHLPDIVITLGGDGTILGAILEIRDLDIPILGINLGRLGFLSTVEKSKIKEALMALTNGGYVYSKRSMIALESNENIFGETPFCLNDFTLSKRETSSMITIHAYVDNLFLNSYWADGLVVSTPTGSTGYSLSVGGPIVFPNSGNFIISPIAPHNLNVRPVVISDSSEIRFKFEGRSDRYLCTLDSRFETISADTEITIKKSKFTTRLINLTHTNFMKTIRNKLLWGIDKRN